MTGAVDGAAGTDTRAAAERRLLALMQVAPDVLARMTTAEIERLAAGVEAAQAEYARLGFVDMAKEGAP